MAAFERWGPGLAKILWALGIPLSVIALLMVERRAANVLVILIGIGVDIGVLVYLANPEVQALYA